MLLYYRFQTLNTLLSPAVLIEKWVEFFKRRWWTQLVIKVLYHLLCFLSLLLLLEPCFVLCCVTNFGHKRLILLFLEFRVFDFVQSFAKYHYLFVLVLLVNSDCLWQKLVGELILILLFLHIFWWFLYENFDWPFNIFILIIYEIVVVIQ